MREIIFRGKRVDNGEWVHGDLIQYESGEIAIFREKLSAYGREATEILRRTKVDIDTASQYTGLTDKNGVKVFEGDVVKQDTCKMPLISEVTFDRGSYFIFDMSMQNYFWTNNGVAGNKRPEVFIIGNKWDNPELLNK